VQQLEQGQTARPVILMRERSTRPGAGTRGPEYNYLVAFEGMTDQEGEW
jgi:hypothetical protein